MSSDIQTNETTQNDIERMGLQTDTESQRTDWTNLTRTQQLQTAAMTATQARSRTDR